MSFAKAKIQRFNELGNDVPPPGTYDPQFKSSIKGVTLDKSDRFNETKSITTTDCSVSSCNRSTNQSSITFRTPQPAQKAVPVRSTKVKSRCILPATDTKLKYTSQNELVDLQIECLNKTKTIEEHVKHIQEMQEERQKLQSQLEDLHKNQAETTERHRKEIESMIQLQQEVLNMHTEKHQSKVEFLQKQVLETCEAKTHEIQTSKDLESDLRSQISDLKEKINTLESELTNQKQISEDKETQNKLVKLEEKSSTQEIEISRLETMNGELDLQLKESKVAINSLTEVNKLLEAEMTIHKDTLAEANTRIEELSNTLSVRGDNVEDKTGLLEEEIARRKAAEEEVRKLLEYNGRLKKDHDEISEQYAGLMGHQNHKQRIKHVSQLKDKINQLEKDLRVKTTKIEQQQKIIEKIKPEEKRVPNKFG